MEKKLYEIKYNDFGIVYVVAEDFSKAEALFWKKYGGNVPNFTIKSIVNLPANSILY